MTWTEYALARSYLTEMRVGTRLREMKAREEALARKGSEAITKLERKRGPR